MRVRDLLEQWQSTSEVDPKEHEFVVKLTRAETAKIYALADMYTGKTPTDIVRDLLDAALTELEATMPYVPGPNAVSEDEHGDPIYEDIGPGPHFKTLMRKHLERLGR
jgi:hypothetical protein